MSAPHTSALDHALAEALHIADSIRFRHDTTSGPELAYSAEATHGDGLFVAMAGSPIEAMAMAMRLLTTAIPEAHHDR